MSSNMTELSILNIPEVALEKILSYLTYEEIANNRLVCRQFNNICGGLLTKGFVQLERKHAHIYKIVKSLLPRRPSERRSNSVISRYCEILQGMETRIRMLNVTYMRYIDQHLIYFVPGKVLDEIKRLLQLIESRFDPPNNNNQLLEELRDLSSMAMEHFDEHILPLLEKKEKVTLFKNAIISNPDTEANSKTLKEFKKLHKRNRLFKTQVTYLASKIRRMVEKCNHQNTRIKKQSSIIKEQNTKLKVQATRLENHEIVISEMRKQIEELQNNFIEIKTEWEMDRPQKKTCVDYTIGPAIKDTGTFVDTNSISRNLKKNLQQESFRQKHNALKKLCSRNSPHNTTTMNKAQFTNLQRDERKRKSMNMIDSETWRRRCPSSRMTYLTYKNNLKSRTEILLTRNHNSNEPCQSVFPDVNTKKPKFVHKTVIKQRASRIFPLSCLDLDRKRKSHAVSDIPSKLIKTEPNSIKAIDLINLYLPAPKQTQKKRNENLSNIIYLESHPPKRKRDGDA